MRLFLSPISPTVTWTTVALLTLFCSLGRIGLFSYPHWSDEGRTLGFSGTTCTLLAAIALTALVGAHAKNYPALFQLGGTFRTWFQGAVRFIALVALVLSAAATITGQVLYAQSEGYYAPFDLFLIDGFSSAPLNTLATFALHTLIFFTAGMLGTIFASTSLGSATPKAYAFVLVCALGGGIVGFFENAIGVLVACLLGLIYTGWVLSTLPRMR